MIVIVLGMHRSGTSLVSGLLCKMSINMGPHFKSGIENLKGYFEDRDFVKLNSTILKQAGGSWRYPPKQKDLMQIIHQNKTKFSNIIKNKNNNKWGWKDPRTILTIDGYMNFLPKNDTKFIIVYRNPLTVAHSLSKKKKHSVDIRNGLNLTSYYNRKIDDFISSYEDYDMLFLAYESLLKNKRGNIDSISDFVNEKTDESIYDFVDTNFDRSSALI